MNYFFTSDTHFGHKNILKYENRPFSCVEEMDETIIRNWNNKIRKNDVVYHLGDFALCNSKKVIEIIKRLNGKIILIKGNHDKLNKDALSHFRDVYSSWYHIKHPRPIFMCHYPMLSWPGAHYLHLYGHIHRTLIGNYFGSLKSFNVCIDLSNYIPWNIEEIK